MTLIMSFSFNPLESGLCFGRCVSFNFYKDILGFNPLKSGLCFGLI